MNLAVEPLYLISIFVNLTVGILVLCIYHRKKDRSASFWFLASVALSLSLGLILFRPLLPTFWTYSVAHTFSTMSSILFGYSLILITDPKIKFPLISVFICVIYGLILGYLVDVGHKINIPIIIAIAWSISLIFAGWMAWKANQILESRYLDLMIWLFAGSVLLWLLRIPPLASDLIKTLGDPGFINVLTLGSIILLGILRQLVYLVIRLSETYKLSLNKQLLINQETETALLSSLVTLASKRDNETGNHLIRTSSYVKILALRLIEMGYYSELLSTNIIEEIYRAAPLHDIGKVGIPDAILTKPSYLSADEREVMKTHALIGESILITAKEQFTDVPTFLNYAIDIAGGHHEHWDGTGYPRGLSAEMIPLFARIMAVADTYDALVSQRIYKNSWSHDRACNEIIRLSGSQFDPKIIEAFIVEIDNFNKIHDLYCD